MIESQACGRRVPATTCRRDCLQVSGRAAVNWACMRVDVPRSALAASILAALALAGCGSAGRSGDPAPAPVKDAATKATAQVKPRATANGVVLTRDPEEGDSFPLPAGTRGAQRAPLPDDAPD